MAVCAAKEISPKTATVTDPSELLRCGVCRASIPTDRISLTHWSTELSQTTPLNFTAEADGEYAFYRNILDEPDFPFDIILKSDIGDTIRRHFGITDLDAEIELDDAFCIHYNTTQADTTCAKHMDPSDITVNMCFEKSADAEGSQVMFYGRKTLHNVDDSGGENDSGGEDEVNKDVKKEIDGGKKLEGGGLNFLVDQEAGFATIHWGCHPHMTTPLTSGKRTNVVLTYCYTDKSRSDVVTRTCYETS